MTQYGLYNMPYEVLHEVFRDLDMETLKSIRTTSKHFLTVTEELIFRDVELGLFQHSLDKLVAISNSAFAGCVRSLRIRSDVMWPLDQSHLEEWIQLARTDNPRIKDHVVSEEEAIRRFYLREQSTQEQAKWLSTDLHATFVSTIKRLPKLREVDVSRLCEKPSAPSCYKHLDPRINPQRILSMERYGTSTALLSAFLALDERLKKCTDHHHVTTLKLSLSRGTSTLALASVEPRSSITKRTSKRSTPDQEATRSARSVFEHLSTLEVIFHEGDYLGSSASAMVKWLRQLLLHSPKLESLSIMDRTKWPECELHHFDLQHEDVLRGLNGITFPKLRHFAFSGFTTEMYLLGFLERHSQSLKDLTLIRVLFPEDEGNWVSATQKLLTALDLKKLSLGKLVDTDRLSSASMSTRKIWLPEHDQLNRAFQDGSFGSLTGSEPQSIQIVKHWLSEVSSQPEERLYDAGYWEDLEYDFMDDSDTDASDEVQTTKEHALGPEYLSKIADIGVLKRFNKRSQRRYAPPLEENTTSTPGLDKDKRPAKRVRYSSSSGKGAGRSRK